MIRSLAATIKGNLGRQLAALGVLADLLAEEFSRLTGRDPQAVSALELSIQELMRQIAAERVDLRRAIQTALNSKDPRDVRLKAVAAMLPAAEREAVEAHLAAIDAREQRCAVQSAKNYELAMALHDQSKGLLDFLRRELTPRQTDIYAANGRFPVAGQKATIRRGAC